MEYTCTQEQTITVCLTGEIDHHSAQYWRERIDAQVQASSCKRLLLDFGGVTFMDSSGVGLIMGRYRLLQRLGGTLGLTGVSPKIGMMLHLAGIDRLGIVKGEDTHESH